MNPNNVWKKNREFYIGVAGTVLEGLLSGSVERIDSQLGLSQKVAAIR